MLGQLLHSINPARRSAPQSQDVSSQVEDFHTKSLLFPNAPFVTPTASASEPPDCHLQTELDLDAARDVRVLIAQGETLALQPLLLFDSKHDPVTEPLKPRHMRTGSRGEGLSHHTRTASGPPRQYGKLPQIASIPESTGRESPSIPSPTSATSTPQRSRFRRSSLSGAAEPEPAPPTRFRETDEIVSTALNCMFENVQTTYRGISNKIKIVQREARPYDSTVCRDTFGNQFALSQSKSMSSTVRRPSGLSSSFTASEPHIETSRQSTPFEDAPRADGSRRTVLITRTFSVKWSDDDAAASTEASDAEKGASEAPSMPTVVIDYGDKSAGQQKPRRLPMKPAPKPPMFAITLVLSLPVSTMDASRPGSRSGGLRRKGSDMNGDWNSLASSFDSGTVIDPLFGLESSVASLSSDVDDRVDKVIGQHWDIIVRTLSSLQHLAEEKILDQLRTATHRGRAPKLLNYALAADVTIKKAATDACHRVARGIKILRVRTGQGRWGMWRDEARWLNKWASEKDKTMFLFSLFTAFLGTHTEWLDVAGPRYYRQQHREQLRLGTSSEPSVPHRTVIVSADKMVARRLVFLLSAFLPGNHHAPGDASPLRPSTAASVRTFSQSPPSHMPLSREESLRRTINRRGKRTPSQQPSSGDRTPQPSSIPSDGDDKTETGTVRSIGEHGHSKRNSADLRSLMNTKVTIVDTGTTSRKSSAMTSPTVTPNLQMAIPHIGIQRKYSSGQVDMRRPDSQDSLASENLMQNLQRSNTGTSLESPTQSRWGSLRSLWSMASRRDSSTNYSDASQADDEGLGIIGLGHTDSHSKLHQMVHEAEAERSRARKIHGTSSPALQSPESELPPGSSASTQPIDVPLKMTVNEQDGVIDVEFPGFSPVNSPPAVAFRQGSSYGSLGFLQSMTSNMQHDTGHSMNVAGFLKIGIHPDFELQATPPYADLVEDVKNAMKAEPTPVSRRSLPDDEAKEEWVDICTSIVADTTSFTIKRFKLRRLVRYLPPPPPPAITPMALPRASTKLRPPARSQYGNPYDDAVHQIPTQVTVEEVFDEEKVMDSDRALMDALERVIAHSGPSSKSGSTASSRANSVRGRNTLSTFDEQPSEIPNSECKKMVIGALEQIATAVERDRRDARKYGGARLRGLNDEMDGVLREGIAKWFEDIEKNRKDIEKQKVEMKEMTEDDTASLATLKPKKSKMSGVARPMALFEVPRDDAHNNTIPKTST